MPDQLLRTLILAFACGHGSLLFAQPAAIDRPAPVLTPRPQVIVLSGVAAEVSSGFFQTFFLSAERPFGSYQHLGLQYSSYLSQSNLLYSHRTLRRGSYEVGLFSKFFLHGRLSRRWSQLYYGPQLRFGVRKLAYIDPYSSKPTLDYHTNTTKVLFCLGGQYRLGPAVFEWSLPLGVEYERSNLPAYLDTYGHYGDGNGRHFTALPGIALGFRL